MDDQAVPGPASPAGVSRLPRAFIALRHRNYQLYFGGQLVSVAGTWMQIVAQGWLVYELSHSELTLGVVGFASAIPALLISPWGGVVVDRMPKRTLLVITQAAAMLLALILAALSFLGHVQVWHVVALSAALGVVNAFDGPARQAFVVEMVGREDLTNAIAMNSMMFNGARVVGPALAGLLLAAVGASWCFLLNGLSFLAVIGGLLAMRLEPRTSRLEIGSPWQQLKAGVGYVYRHAEIFALLLLALIFSVFGISYGAILPAFVDQSLRGGPTAFGAVNAATGLGAVAGALVVARYGDRGRRGRWLVLANLAFPLILAAFAWQTSVGPALALAFGLGVGFMLQFTLINTLLQTRVADAVRGRVLSLYTLTFFGFAPFGNLAIGILAEALGLSLTITLSAAVALALSLAVIAIVPRVRRLP
ncbi:MAG: MFS transporter [Anaerolineales bacterium]|nr:MFS transporter [Anaerolineales bacterium]